ncbi:MAG: MFS transporter [Limnohabitans sp.]|nr:MFS transporter [Limnohabitans sp.]
MSQTPRSTSAPQATVSEEAPSRADRSLDPPLERPLDQPLDRRVLLAVAVAALGYFVDLFDLVLFTILRVPSLKAIGITDPDELTRIGKRLLDVQLIGMLLGGLAFGMLGDRFGRLKTLFGSILLYSVANILNAFVTDVWQYEVLRFIAGFGLAGELGAGITLVAEILPTAKRGLGTAFVAVVGLCGAVAAAVAGKFLAWNHCYLLGGSLGLALLALRIGVAESGLFEETRAHAHRIRRGNPLQLVWPPRRAARFALVILSGMPIWFVGGVMFVFAPELGRAMKIEQAIEPPRVIFWAYLGVVVGDVVSGLLSQWIQSRRRTMLGFLVALAASIVGFFLIAPKGPWHFYLMMSAVGAATGYWAIFVTTASEQFGTNLRATAATSAPNFVRAMAVPITSIWLYLKGTAASQAAASGTATIEATLWLGLTCVAIGFVATLLLEETFHRDLDYYEH